MPGVVYKTMNKRQLIWRWALAISIIIILLLIRWYRNQRENSEKLHSQIESIKEQTCYDKFVTLDEIKEEHTAALENVKDLYRNRGEAQFEAKRWTGETTTVTEIYKQIVDQEDQLSWLEMRSWEVRQSIANCNQ